ncbi:heavy-metal-associated domain-containing protein [bacterium]|nr:heavy-metal-associated domain-containing protein [bacterium]
MTHGFTVSGMTCDSCRAAVRAALGRVPGVLGVDVDLESGAALVAVDPAGDPGLAALLEAVRAAGYKATA